MYLANVDIHGFKGIKHLTLSLNKDSNVLIGENRWGRSSLISALMLLSLDNLFYQFVDSDFYYDEHEQVNEVNIRFTFSESVAAELQLAHYLPLVPVSYFDAVLNKRLICYQIIAVRQANSISTQHYLLDEQGHNIAIDNAKALITTLVALNPVMNLKNPVASEQLPVTNQPLTDHYFEQLSSQLAQYSESFSTDDLEKGVIAAQALLEYYLVDRNRRHHYKNIVKKETPSYEDWSSLDKMNDLFDRLDNDDVRLVFMGIFSSMVLAKGNNKFSANALPILILQEPESHLHPILLSVGFRLLKNFPCQKMITTNSSDLVAQFSLEHIYHLIRQPAGIVARHIADDSLNSGDVRRILFHILYRRASSIFARCWLLVEGETEVWLLRELAEQSGIHFSSEGVQLIEFAQCGLKPLIKYANAMGIAWHVLTDGDIAGKKYANTVRSLCPNPREISHYLTVLPARDMENFLFKNGFSQVYKMIGYATTEHIDLPVHKIIKKAIHKSSKPDLAIAICDDVKRRGVEAIPSLLKQMFNKVVKLAKVLH